MSKQLLNRLYQNIELLTSSQSSGLNWFKHCSPVIQKRYRYKGGRHLSPLGGPPVRTHPTKEWAHKWYRWGYEELPAQTAETVENPLFAIRPPEFRLPKRRMSLSRKLLRQRMAEVSAARSDGLLEKLSRDRQLFVDINEVEEEWKTEFGLADINNLANFYALNRDLFNNEHIDVETWLSISFGDAQIHRGNILKPSLLLSPPTTVNYTSEGSFTTLVLTNLDGHIKPNSEILHWLVCNIPDNVISNGTTLVEYLPPFPFKGTGYHRFVFSLYKHNNVIDETEFTGEGKTLSGRTFSSHDFASSLDMKPIGLAWCQVHWDESVTSTCSLLEDLNGEPMFELEEYIDPKQEFRNTIAENKELNYRNM